MSNIDDAEARVKKGVQKYHWALTSLNVVIGSDIISRLENRETRDRLEWLYPEPKRSTQTIKSSERVKGTGNWITKSEQFINWVDGDDQLLVCTGIRMFSFEASDDKPVQASLSSRSSVQRLYLIAQFSRGG